MNEKYGIAGAKETTPSIPEYFSWVNNTNEGSTEEQTLINLDFFRYMQETYGMQIKLYLWDAGNFDGAEEGYGNVNSEKFRSQYPNGYKKVVDTAASLGIRMGLWGSPDGFGDDPETEKERVEFFVHLCRDYNFGVFKLDGVCGTLRPEKAGVFAKMIEECRKYCPDLVIQNHRLDFYEAEKYITTFLFNGAETYTDVFSSNLSPAMHNREYMFRRGYVENENGLVRLAEDHGVCLSSSLDYFEDELIYQAFGRGLIIAPEIYGSPWLIKDEELPKLARVYNLHRRHAADIVSGIKLPAEYGADAVSRGNGKKCFITTGNDSWDIKSIKITLDASIGLDKTCDNLFVNLRHPHNEHLGKFSYGDTVTLELMPFRATLVEIAPEKLSDPILQSCKYEVIKESEDGESIEVKTLDNDTIEKAPMYLGELCNKTEKPLNGEFLYESAMFAIDNDSLEYRCLKRSGDTKIPEVKAARDAFFNQEAYVLRGCDSCAMFDGEENTFFDSQSRTYDVFTNGLRINDGCLRVDLGETVFADEIEFEVFSTDIPFREIAAQQYPVAAEYSNDLKCWKKSGKINVSPIREETLGYYTFLVHSKAECHGKRKRLTYKIGDRVRYIRIPNPMDHIFSLKVKKNGKTLKLSTPFANNLQSPYSESPVEVIISGEVTLPSYRDGAYLATAVYGSHGEESAFCTVEIDGKTYGANGRAPTFKCNIWDHTVCPAAKNTTHFFTLPKNCEGKKIKVNILLCDKENTDVKCKVYLCDKHI